jgi:hypothetical protein
MAHFAKINNENLVLTVLTLNNEDMLDINGIPQESIGQQYLEKHNNWPASMWIQTSYNTINNRHIKGGIPFRGNFAAIGHVWDSTNNIFYPQKPFISWNLNLTIADWEAPISRPTLTQEQISDVNYLYNYIWNESNQSWDLVSYQKPNK